MCPVLQNISSAEHVLVCHSQLCDDSIFKKCLLLHKKVKAIFALAGNRTRASRVAGENSTTEPPMLDEKAKYAITRCQDEDTYGSWTVSSLYTSKLKEEVQPVT